MPISKIRYYIKFQNYDKSVLTHNLVVSVFDIKKKLNFVRKTCVANQPNKVKYFCVLRSPFVDNVSREHLELRVFSKVVVLDILDPKNPVIEGYYDKLLFRALSVQESQVVFKKIKVRV